MLYRNMAKPLAKRILKQIGVDPAALSQPLYLASTYAPAPVFAAYLKGRFGNRKAARPYEDAVAAFRQHADRHLELSQDWSTLKFPYWLRTFDDYALAERPGLNLLEIGSWEGLSAYFLLHALPNATLTCVDTWEGGDEHRSGAASPTEQLSSIERRFDANMARFGERLVKYKGSSLSYFNGHPQPGQFDLIYVDGSHHCDDVVVDALKCFDLLAVGGLMIFDDYFWRYYPRAIDNPAAAINVFLRLKKDCYRIVRVYYQLIIEKTAAVSTRQQALPSAQAAAAPG